MYLTVSSFYLLSRISTATYLKTQPWLFFSSVSQIKKRVAPRKINKKKHEVKKTMDWTRNYFKYRYCSTQVMTMWITGFKSTVSDKTFSPRKQYPELCCLFWNNQENGAGKYSNLSSRSWHISFNWCPVPKNVFGTVSASVHAKKPLLGG